MQSGPLLESGWNSGRGMIEEAGLAGKTME
jgi:hypothetical protein